MFYVSTRIPCTLKRVQNIYLKKRINIILTSCEPIKMYLLTRKDSSLDALPYTNQSSMYALQHPDTEFAMVENIGEDNTRHTHKSL